jgi:hypothetical protein
MILELLLKFDVTLIHLSFENEKVLIKSILCSRAFVEFFPLSLAPPLSIKTAFL